MTVVYPLVKAVALVIVDLWTFLLFLHLFRARLLWRWFLWDPDWECGPGGPGEDQGCSSSSPSLQFVPLVRLWRLIVLLCCVVLCCHVSSTTTGTGAAWPSIPWPWCPSRSSWWRRSCSLRRRWSWWRHQSLTTHHALHWAHKDRVVMEVPTGGHCSSLVCCVLADQLGEPVPQDVPGSGGGGARTAGQEGGPGMVVQRDAANRLREKCSVSCWWPAGGTLRWCIVKPTRVAAVLLKIETWMETVIPFFSNRFTKSN